MWRGPKAHADNPRLGVAHFAEPPATAMSQSQSQSVPPAIAQEQAASGVRDIVNDVLGDVQNGRTVQVFFQQPVTFNIDNHYYGNDDDEEAEGDDDDDFIEEEEEEEVEEELPRLPRAKTALPPAVKAKLQQKAAKQQSQTPK